MSTIHNDITDKITLHDQIRYNMLLDLEFDLDLRNNAKHGVASIDFTDKVGSVHKVT